MEIEGCYITDIIYDLEVFGKKVRKRACLNDAQCLNTMLLGVAAREQSLRASYTSHAISKVIFSVLTTF